MDTPFQKAQYSENLTKIKRNKNFRETPYILISYGFKADGNLSGKKYLHNRPSYY